MNRVSLSETFAVHHEQFAQHSKASMASAARLESSLGQLQGTLAMANEIAEKAARFQEEQSIRQRIADEEKQEQKEIKNAAFSFKQDLDIVLKGASGLKRYMGLKSLSDVGKMELTHYTNKLNELNDKEYANNLLNTVYDSANETYRSLTDVEKDDLRKFEQLWTIQNELGGITETINDAQRNLTSRQPDLVQYQKEYELNKKLPSRIGAAVKMMLVIAFTLQFVFLPLPLLFVGGIRRWVWNLYKAIINGSKPVDESAQKVSATQQEITKLESTLKSAFSSLEEAKLRLVARENELASLFRKYDLSAS